MKYNKLATLFGVALILPTFLVSEISVFDAGNINNTNPYGLTSSEKEILKSKQEVTSVKQEVGTLQEQIEGLRSVFEGSNERLNRVSSKISELENNVSLKDDNLTKEIENLKAYVKESREIEEQNYAKIRKVLKELSSLIDSINANYISKSKFEEYKKSNINIKENKNTDDFSTTKSNKDVMQDALDDFKNKKYQESKKQFEYLISKQYRPAFSNYYLGEIEYFQQNYKSAIEYYQKSIALYDKADYIPRLLYHTAISFDKLGEVKKANQFYRVLKQDYPETKEAKASPTR